jgi:hypothetical protein
MEFFEHPFRQYFQNQDADCGPTTLAMQLSALNIDLSPAEVALQALPFRPDGAQGFTSQELANFASSLKLKTEFYSFDGRVLDYSWQGWSSDLLVPELEFHSQWYRNQVPMDPIGSRYTDSYLGLLKGGASLHIRTNVTCTLINKLLETGPVNAGVAFGVFSGEGKKNIAGESDPLKGNFQTHSILIYGVDEDGMFLVADPMPNRGKLKISPDHLIAAISAAQFENDNSIFQISLKRSSP